MLNRDKPVKVNIDKDLCTSCGMCVKVCHGYLLLKDTEIVASEDSPFGCIQCGLCMMHCPHGAINVVADRLSKDLVFDLDKDVPDYKAVNALFKKRRSIRKFKKQEVDKETLEKIIDAGSTSPISIPPSEIKVVVVSGYEKVKILKEDMYKGFEKMLKFFNPVVLTLFRPIMGKIEHSIVKDFVIPLFKETLKAKEHGEDMLFYNAPAVIIFYGSEYSDKEDAILAASFASIGAEALGLGTCIIGSVAPVLERNKQLRAKYGIKDTDKIYTSFIVGYPDVVHTKGITREFLEVNYV